MTVKTTPNDLKLKNLSENYFKYPRAGAGRHKAEYISLHYRHLRPNTKYKVLLNNDEGNKLEDLTEFCMPAGDSRKYNTHRNNKIWRYFVSSSSGELKIRVRPYGTNSVDPLTKSWVNTWKFFDYVGREVDFGRTNIKLVEYSQVDDAGAITRFKNIKIDANVGNIGGSTLAEADEKFIQQQTFPKFIQTFYIDPNAINQAKSCDLLDIVLYFRKVPGRKINISGIDDPGVNIYLVDVENDRPNVKRQYKNSLVSKKWVEITASPDASVPTTFTFAEPVTLQTGRFYGVCIDFEDDNYLLWQSKKGEALVITGEVSPGSSKEHRGELFQITNIPVVADSSSDTTLNNDIYRALDDQDIKFDVDIAEYNLDDVSLNLVNSDYEFLNLSNTTHNFWGGEYIYQQTANSAGSIAITAGSSTVTGSGTNFSTLNINDQIVLVDSANNEICEVVKVALVTSATVLELSEPVIATINGNYKIAPIATVEHYNFYTQQLILNNSNAESGKVFEANGVVIGVESGEVSVIDEVKSYPLSVFRTDFNMFMPSNFEVTAKYNYSYDDSGTFRTSNNSTFEADLNFISPNYIRDYSAIIMSRSLEVENSTNLYKNDKSTVFGIDFKFKGVRPNVYESPTLDISYLNTLNTTWLINNDATNEHTNVGNALTKHISTKLTFGKDKAAEDIRVILNAYRPLGTDIKVYAKILNDNDPAPFDDKSWTELTLTSGQNEFSSNENFADFREYEFGFPAFPPTATTLLGVIETEQGNATIIGVGTNFTSTLVAGDVIRIYNSLFADINYGVFSVSTVTNDTQLVLSEPVTNVNIVDSGLKIDTLATPYTAFNNADNLNIVRYFGAEGQSYDTYSTVAIKTVLLAEDRTVVPRVDDYRVIGVSS
jgi:hypothetical protein